MQWLLNYLINAIKLNTKYVFKEQIQAFPAYLLYYIK